MATQQEQYEKVIAALEADEQVYCAEHGDPVHIDEDWMRAACDACGEYTGLDNVLTFDQVAPAMAARRERIAAYYTSVAR